MQAEPSSWKLKCTFIAFLRGSSCSLLPGTYSSKATTRLQGAVREHGDLSSDPLNNRCNTSDSDTRRVTRWPGWANGQSHVLPSATTSGIVVATEAKRAWRACESALSLTLLPVMYFTICFSPSLLDKDMILCILAGWLSWQSSIRCCLLHRAAIDRVVGLRTPKAWSAAGERFGSKRLRVLGDVDGAVQAWWGV